MVVWFFFSKISGIIDISINEVKVVYLNHAVFRDFAEQYY